MKNEIFKPFLNPIITLFLPFENLRPFWVKYMYLYSFSYPTCKRFSQHLGYHFKAPLVL